MPIQSSVGFAYSMELLARCHRLGWPMAEVPAHWFERTRGLSRFRVLEWAPTYQHWYFHVRQTSWLLPRAVSKLS